MNRREFLWSSVALPAVAAAAEKAAPAVAAPPGDWAALRSEFELSSERVHTGLFFLATHPRAVREAIEKYRKGLDADPLGYIEEHHGELDAKVNEAAAEYLDVKPDELALT